jgi:hypothetical protein
MRLFLLLTFCLCSIAQATETPLILNAQGGNGYAVVNVASGAITLYGVEGQSLVRYGSANFLTDLNERRDRIYDQDKDGNVYSYLRTGSPNFTPTAGELINRMPTAATDGTESYQQRAVASENAFWKKTPEYDGLVRGAYSRNAIMLAIPSLHTLMIYEIVDRNRGPKLKAWRNYGPDLMIPQIYESQPTPKVIVERLQTTLKNDAGRLKELEAQLLQIEKGGAITLASGEPVLLATASDRFLLIDTANHHLIAYEWLGGKARMTGARNTQVDLLIPVAMNSTPNPAAALADFAQTYRKEMTAAGIPQPLDEDILSALIAQGKTRDKIAKVQQVSSNNGDVVIDYTDLHKLFVYRVQGTNNSLELVSMRDYTLDLGLAALADLFNDQVRGQAAMQDVIKRLEASQYDSAMLVLHYVASVAPKLVLQTEKELKFRPLTKHPDWADLMTFAKNQADADDAKRKAWALKAEELKKKK